MNFKHMTMLAALCLAVTTTKAQTEVPRMGIFSPLAAASDATELWGGIVYSGSWEQDYYAGRTVPFGYYSFLSNGEGGFSPLYTDDQDLQPDGGAMLTGDTLHMVHDIYGYGSHMAIYKEYDVRTWKTLRTEALYDYGLSAFDLAQDPTTGLVYGEFSSTDSNEPDFGTIDYKSLTKNVIAKMDTTFIGLAFDTGGQLYGVNADGNLYIIDKTTGSYDLVGATGLKLAHYRQSAAIDPLTGDMFLTAQTTDGKAALYIIDLSTGQAQKAWQYDDNQQITGLVIRQHGVTMDSPAEISDATYTFSNGSLNGTVTFTAPKVDHSGASLSGSLKAYVVANGDTLATGSVTPGQKGTLDISVPEAGKYRMELLTSNNKGLSNPQRTTINWIGYDKPYIKSTNLTIDHDTRIAKVSWSTPLTGTHGGYVSKDELRFNVYRNPDSKQVLSNSADSSFTETLPEGEQKLYSYSIIPFNGSTAGDTVTTEQKALGSYVTVPYRETFDTKASVGEVWTNVDANNDGVVWTWSNGRAVYNAGNNFGNDYLLSPQIRLSAGHIYKLAFTVHGGNGHRLQIKVGQGEDPTDRKSYSVLMKTTEFPNDVDTAVTQNIQVNTDGLYRIAFRTTSDAHSVGLQLDNISLAEGISISAPDSVKALAAIPAAKGELKATVAFNMPTTSISGNTLNGTLKANVYRSGNLIGTVSDLRPGVRASFTDNAPVNGFNSYSVAAADDNGEGIADSVRVYVGQDIPYAVRNVRLKDNLDGTSTLSWDAPDTLGKHGGYVDAGKLKYTIFLDDYDIMPDTVVTGTTYTMNHSTKYDQTTYWYTVHVSNIAGEGDQESSNMLLSGEPYQLPYKDSFRSGAAETVWWLDSDVHSQGFRLNHTTSADQDNGCIYWGATKTETLGAIYSGMINISGHKRPTLSFWYYEVPGFNCQLSFTACKNMAEDHTVWSHDFSKATGNAGWKHVTVDLSDLTNSSYIVLKIIANSSQEGYAVYLDDIEVKDVPDHELALKLQAPKSWTAGRPTTMLATITNNGANEETATLDITENGSKLANIDNLVVKEGTDTAIVIPYTPSTTIGTVATISAKIESSNEDEDESNNSATASIDLRESTLPAPTDLKLDGGNLSWTAPVYSGTHTITDGFEDYTPWMINAIGLWTTRDDDHLPSYSFQQQFPYSGTAYAFIVTNPTNIGADITRDDLKGIAPHDGNQYLTAFSAIGAQSSDWLISPELSGEAQTIKFWAKGISTSYNETFEVYAGDNLLEKVNADGSSWQEYSYNLPAGTKHFSIHYTGNDKFGLMVDDVTYSDGVINLTGYAVYNNGELVATVPAGTTTWQVNNSKDGEYSVVANYNVGNSQPCTASGTTGINNINVDANDVHGQSFNVAGQKVPAYNRGMVIIRTDNGSVIKKVNK